MGFNINLGGNWSGGQVTFFGVQGQPEQDPISVTLRRGHAVLHAGLDMHQAEMITSGRRENLIFWCRSSEVRNARCPMCFDAPRCVATNLHSHEGFTVPPCRVVVEAEKKSCVLF